MSTDILLLLSFPRYKDQNVAFTQNLEFLFFKSNFDRVFFPFRFLMKLPVCVFQTDLPSSYGFQDKRDERGAKGTNIQNKHFF